MPKLIVAGKISYDEVLGRCIKESALNPLKRRLVDLSRTHDGEFFLSPIHESRFNIVCRLQNEPVESRTTTYFSTLFLLTAYDRLWCVTKDYVYFDNFDFKKMHLNGIITDGCTFVGTFRENIIWVIGNYNTKDVTTEYDEQIDKLQNQMMVLIEENAKQGAVSEEFDEA